MRWISLLLIGFATAQANEIIKTTIAPVMADVEGALKVPNQIPHLNWDPKGIRIINRHSEDNYSLLLRGKISMNGVKSFAYQVEGKEAQRIKLSRGRFDVEIPLDRSPVVIRLWVEVLEGKAVRVYHDLLKVRAEMIDGDTDQKATY